MSWLEICWGWSFFEFCAVDQWRQTEGFSRFTRDSGAKADTRTWLMGKANQIAAETRVRVCNSSRVIVTSNARQKTHGDIIPTEARRRRIRRRVRFIVQHVRTQSVSSCTVAVLPSLYISCIDSGMETRTAGEPGGWQFARPARRNPDEGR